MAPDPHVGIAGLIIAGIPALPCSQETHFTGWLPKSIPRDRRSCGAGGAGIRLELMALMMVHAGANDGYSNG